MWEGIKALEDRRLMVEKQAVFRIAMAQAFCGVQCVAFAGRSRDVAQMPAEAA